MDRFITKKSTLPEVLARLTAVNCISFRALSSSTDIQEFFRSQNILIPKDPRVISKIIIQHAEEVFGAVRDHIQNYKNEERLFATTMDEFT